jgi:TPR repeat protein
MQSNIKLRDEYRKLMQDRRFDEARVLLKGLTESDSVFALTALADVEFEAGNRLESELLIQRAESVVDASDLEGHLDLVSAYRLGLGGHDRDFQDRMALKHMHHVASAGNPVVQMELANHYRYGLNGCAQSKPDAIKWLELAAEVLPSAKKELKEWQTGND